MTGGVLGLVLTGSVAVLHAYILVMEMFLWTRPRTRKVFGTTADFAEQTRVLAGNQGLYNGFLAAGLVWALWSIPAAIFFLTCVMVAGLYGAATVSKRIFYVQTVPAALALAARLAGL